MISYFCFTWDNSALLYLIWLFISRYFFKKITEGLGIWRELIIGVNFYLSGSLSICGLYLQKKYKQ